MMTGDEILDIRFCCDDLDGEVSIREYLATLLQTLWDQGEGFSGKRPFGNSGWCIDLYCALVAGGAIAGKVDEEYGDLLEYDRGEAHEAILRAIAALTGTGP